ncbi:G-type lectin S-receptor-like serine/threonine-protein kinase At2g19130 [Phragmites australis]|uniref:G-type lectin S-receptor-like serine/threonine-protein kinase At2g19130 n=1 Tax=Phragmites australis TaxID=29695 RepID=UPI002D772A3F|nr:G-type lectin S-receptor-like serine/threonine-protein kinase At2g19130 [Phragmites australis]
MTSWRALGDPAPGMYTLQLDPAGAPQYVLLWNGTREYWVTGDWNGRFFTGAPEVAASSGNSGYSFQFVDNDRESYFTYNFADNSTVYRFVTDVSGQVKGWFWVEATQGWNLVYAEPKARCAVPRGCGAFGVCSEAVSTACNCARGFRPRDAASWSLGDYTGGCVRNTELQCGKNGSGGDSSGSNAHDDRFFRLDDMRLPDDGRIAGAASSGDCERACLGDCTCSAYAYNGSCFLWHDDLQNLEDGFGGQAGAGSLYLRLAASDLPSARTHKRRTVEIAVGALAIVCFVVAASVLVVRTIMARTTKVQGLTTAEGCVTRFKYRDLHSITKNFSDKLGGGAFGSVFRGQLPDRTAVAVKKLEGLRQGEKQFRAEVSTLGTIQHVNLIHLLGFCSEGGDRKLLVYEYMPNGSLDRHLFGATLYTLSWRARYQIAVGVAKGLAYLHDKCRDCIIHCDVKPENILLDADFAPKVADFGLAKLVGRDFSRVLTTMRGTIGYLAPEWISGEAITAKADVFSYGMMLFEIVSGRRNVEHGKPESGSESSASSAGDHAVTEATFFPVLTARRLAEADGDVAALLDTELGGDANVEQVRRVCKVACWCIQHGVDARPTMAEVVQVLEGVTDIELPPVPRYLEVLAGRPMHETLDFSS